MALDLYGLVGKVRRSVGATGPVRLGKDSELVTAAGSATLQELVVNGSVYMGGTAATGVAPGTSIGTAAAHAIYNPAGSGKLLVILSTSLGYVSGTLGAGVIHWCANNNPAAAATTGTAITEINALVGASGNNVGQLLTSATLPANPTIARVFCSLQASLASTAVAPWVIRDHVDGALVVKPGCTLSLQATAAAGSTPLVVYTTTWLEIDE